jgi:hypothetical protein
MATRLSVCLCCSIVAHLACGSDAFAQAPVRKIRQKMTDTFNNTPDFMCSVNIERTARTGKEAPSTLQPLHVNAGIVNGKEMYALPSTDDDQAILRKVLSVYSRAGTGTFAMFARAVFLTSDATFYDGPEESKDGRTLARLDFAMPREVSHLSLNNLLHAVQVGYSGSIWTDPRNLEVARMLLRADGIPPDLGIKAVTQTIEYGRAPILGMSTLLPLATDLTMQETSGQELRITGRFRDCHGARLRGISGAVPGDGSRSDATCGAGSRAATYRGIGTREDPVRDDPRRCHRRADHYRGKQTLIYSLTVCQEERRSSLAEGS